jgi:hypothetical protein
MKSNIPAPARPTKPTIELKLEGLKSEGSVTCTARHVGTLSVDGKNMATWFTMSDALSVRVGELIRKFYEHQL